MMVEMRLEGGEKLLRWWGIVMMQFQITGAACRGPCCRKEHCSFNELKTGILQDMMLHFLYIDQRKRNVKDYSEVSHRTQLD